MTSPTIDHMTRREAFLIGPATFMLPSVSLAADEAIMSTSELLESLRAIPTFCIVNEKTGAAYMLYKKSEQIAKGYAFTTMRGALAVLGDAKRAADEGGYADVWEDATITTIPADIAIRLALQPKKRTSQRDDQNVNTILEIIPGVEERDEATKMDRKFSQQAKVPLFYVESLKLADGATPLYFTKNDLLADWTKYNPNNSPPANEIKLLRVDHDIPVRSERTTE